MNASVEAYLALLLFLPWFAILGALFWWYPRQPRGAARRAWDIASLLAATLVFVLALRWAQAAADPSYGRLWRQVFATSVGYGLFLAVLLAAFLLRRRWLSRRGAPGRRVAAKPHALRATGARASGRPGPPGPGRGAGAG